MRLRAKPKNGSTGEMAADGRPPGSRKNCTCEKQGETSAGGCGKSPAPMGAGGPLTPLPRGSSWRVAVVRACLKGVACSCRLVHPPMSEAPFSSHSRPFPCRPGTPLRRIARSRLIPALTSGPRRTPPPRFPRHFRSSAGLGQLPRAPAFDGLRRRVLKVARGVPEGFAGGPAGQPFDF